MSTDISSPDLSLAIKAFIRSLSWNFHVGAVDKPISHPESHSRLFPFFVFVYVHKGHFRSTFYDGSSLDVLAGETLVIPNGVHHTFGAVHPGVLTYAHINYTIFEGTNLLHYFKPRMVIRGPDALSIGKTIAKIVQSMHRLPENLKEQILWAIEVKILHETLLKCLVLNSELDGLRSQRFSLLQRLEPALQLVNRQLERPIGREEMAQACSLSATRFHYIFKEATGVSPIAYVKAARLGYSQTLLASTELSISEIAAKVGYQSVFQFSRQFHVTFHMTPSQYRKAAKEW